MADADRYDDVWNRVKQYIPFLQELISYYKNDSHQNREQQLQKIITIYDLLTNQRLNYQSLCKCENVLIKLHKTNPLQKKASSTTAKPTNEPDTPASPGEPEAQNESDQQDRDSSDISDGPPGLESGTPTKDKDQSESGEAPPLPDTPAEPDTPAGPDSPAEPDIPGVPDTPAEPDSPDEPDTPAEPDEMVDSQNSLEPLSPETDSEYWDDPPPRSSKPDKASQPPLSLDEIQRLITSKPEPSGARTGNNLSKVINDTLKVLSKDFQRPTFTDHDRNPSPPTEDSHNIRNRNVPYSPTYPPQISPNQPFSGGPWETNSDGFGAFPHPVNNSFRNIPTRTNSPPLYRRRDDMLSQMDLRFQNDMMDISPPYVSPSDGRSVVGPPASVSSIKDPRLRKAVESNMLLHSPDSPGSASSPFFPTVKPNDPRFNRTNPNLPPPNELPKCIAPNPNLPLESAKKEPPKRRLSICVNQVIIEEIPPEPIIPLRQFPQRRQSICHEFNSNRNNEPFHGTSFLPPGSAPPLPPMMPPPPQPMAPLMGQPIPSLINSHAMHIHPPQSIPAMHPPEPLSLADRDPRRKHMQHGNEFLKPLPSQPPQPPHHHIAHPANRFDRPIPGPSKAPSTYLEHRRQREMNEKQQREHKKSMHSEGDKGSGGKEKPPNQQKDQKHHHGKDKRQNEEIDITIGMIPNKNRVSAKAYAKPAKSFIPKERHFAPSAKDKHQKFPSHKSHKSESSSTSHRSDKKHDESEKEKIKAVPKSKDLFGEQLSQFDKMYRSGDFAKKAAPASGIGGFKIPKIKRIEKPEPPTKPNVPPPHSNPQQDKFKKDKQKQKAKSKSPEPTNTMDDDDDMWDTDSSVKPPVESKPHTEEAKGNNKKKETPATIQSLEDDDFWDAESSFNASDSNFNSSAAMDTSTNSTEPADVEDKPKDEDKPKEAIEEPPKVEFQVPTLPAPRRILRRRNSVAIHNNEPETWNKPPVPSLVLPPRITRRRNSIAVSNAEDHNRNTEKVEKEPALPAKPSNEQPEMEVEPEEVVRPRRTRKRKVIVDDDAVESPNTDIAPKMDGSADTNTSHGDSEERNTSVTVAATEDHSDNVVSSTTNDTTVKKRRGRKKKDPLEAASEQNASSDTSQIDSNDQKESPQEELPAKVGNDSVSEKSVDQTEEQLSETAKEIKEEQENKEMVEGLMKISNNKAQLLAMLSQMLDEKKLKKIQEIIDSPNDKLSDDKPSVAGKIDETDSAPGSSRESTSVISSTNDVVEKKKQTPKAKKSELDKLNEDIAEMYIRDGVLSATGRRSCTRRHDFVAPAPRTVSTRKSANATVIVDEKPSIALEAKAAPAIVEKPTTAKKVTSTIVKSTPVQKVLQKGMELDLADRSLMKPLKVVIQKIDSSQMGILSNRKRKIEDDLTSIASSATSLSPKSKRKKKSIWASGTIQRRKKKADVKPSVVSPLKSYAAKPLTKNVTRDLNCRSDKSKSCALCSYTGSMSGIVQHYVRYHPLHEVYVSRLSSMVANKLKKDPTIVSGIIEDQNITFKCLFCQEVLCKKKYNWKMHLASHTGEYRYKCTNCTIKSLAPSTNAHDSECSTPAMEVVNDVMFEGNHIYGYMCRLCNYVQLTRSRLEAHLKEEHGRNLTGKGTLKFSILNYDEVIDHSKSQETLESDISMPELTPQASAPSQTDMSAFISSANDEIESLKVLNDRNFVSPSKPSIIDKLKQNFDEIDRKDAVAEKKKTSKGDEDEWEDIDTPPKETPTKKKATPKRTEKVKRSLARSTSPSQNIPMPTPLAMKNEKVDIFENKQLVANVGFSNTNGTIWYLCLIGDCKFATEKRPEMYCHVEEQHGSIVWDGYCYLCTAQVSTEETSPLKKEVKHMAVIHIKDRTAFEELNEHDVASVALKLLEEEQSTLKLRRFSGDKLSMGTTEGPINIKPWLEKPTTKNRDHCVNMLEPRSLYCFFKCMGTGCCFTTTVEVSMEKHIDNHELVGDVTGAAVKSWLECPYCDVLTEDRTDLLRHLRIVHSNSAYQCTYCFYRSREAYNVILHQKLHHGKEKPQVLVNEVDKRPLTAADYERLNRRPIDNILPLICTVCNAEYCVLDAFMSHLKDDHPDVTTIVCQCCKENIQKLKIPRHLLLHNIGIYECIYCHFGSNTMDAVQTHVCNRHPQEPLYCCIRYNKTPGKVKEASLKSLYEMPVDESTIVKCTFTSEELNYKSTDTKSNHDINFTGNASVIPLQLPPIRFGDTNIFLSAQIPSTSTATTCNESVVVAGNTAEVVKMPMISAVSGGVSLSGTTTAVPIITAVQGNYQEPSTSTIKTPQAPMVMPVISQVVGGASVPSVNMPIITRVEGGVGDVATLRSASSLVQSPKEDDAIMLEAERVAMEMIKDTGLPKNVIYKCVFKGCNSVLPDGIGMRKHLTFSHLPSTQYICSHCKGKPSFQNVMSFTQHLKTHEAQRIFCFMCDYKGSFPPEVIKHVKDVHKTSKPTILFLNPKKNDPNNDIILFAPGIPTDAERKAYYKKLIDLYNHKLQAALIHLKTRFAPDECESLPKQAIFSQTVFCSKCQYSTKVRLNMYRHLKGHLNDMPVSNMDPKNPVPCWGQGEKHFDRMRNPAASSQEDDDLIQSLCFVQENKRYICGAPDCRYLTINETMLRNHLSTLHADVKEYKCPHCPAVQIFSAQLNVPKVLEHLKLHDKELYRCSKCSIFMNKKNEIDQHVNDKHPSQNASVYVIRDGSTAGSAATVGMSEDGIVFKWKCDVCKFKSPSLSEMKLHMQETHSITAKYRCSRCLYSCSNKSAFTTHFDQQHPGCEIVIISLYKAIEGDDSRADTTPLWRRETSKTRSIRGILLEDEDEDEYEQIPSEMAQMAADSQPGPSGVSIPRKRKSTENSETGISPKRVKEDSYNSAVRAFKCGFKGCNYVNDFGAGIVSHFRSAHPNEKPSVIKNALANSEQSRFDYFMKYACFYCVKKSDTIQDLLAHWRQIHKITGRRSQDKPFLFRTSKIILCFYCRKGAVMPEMKSHFISNHPGHQPIYLDFRNPRRCAECEFTMGLDKQEMIAHFAKEHTKENEYANGWIDFLTDDVVDKILQLNNVVYRCEKCDFITDNKTDFTIHYATKHPGLRVEFNEYEMEKNIVYYCAFNNCKSSHNSPQALAMHISQHMPLFKCMCNIQQCSAQFRTFTMLLQHFNTTHPLHDHHYALKTPEEYKAVLRSINIQFWNGFVMTLDDARRAGNRYGSYNHFFKHIDELCAQSVAEALPTS
ncbi:uncharacterized protein LOC134219640 isoform X2 [Armigeres subalbatus]|uniref:uncharacterized protein LOC134219640 isoform X2 n=1 Tax=Armigeres subalbatus TaxID=124917 RepID=UPI002ED6631C